MPILVAAILLDDSIAISVNAYFVSSTHVILMLYPDIIVII